MSFVKSLKPLISQEELDKVQEETNKIIWNTDTTCRYCQGVLAKGVGQCPICKHNRFFSTRNMRQANEFKLKKLTELKASKIAELKASKKMSSRGRMRIARKRYQIETDDWRCHKKRRKQ